MPSAQQTDLVTNLVGWLASASPVVTPVQTGGAGAATLIVYDPVIGAHYGLNEAQTGETKSYADLTQDNVTSIRFPTSERRLSLNGTGSYSFSTNVTGNLALGYGEDDDRQRNFKRRNVRVELRAQFTF